MSDFLRIAGGERRQALRFAALMAGYAAERYHTQKVDCCANPPYPYQNAEAAILKASAFLNAIFAAEY